MIYTVRRQEYQGPLPIGNPKMTNPNTPLFSQTKFIRLLWWIVVGLVTLHLTIQAIHYYIQEVPWLFRGLFDVDEEESFSTWFSTIILFISAMLLLLTAQLKDRKNDPFCRHWYGLALGFILLSMDEIVGLHETLNTLTEVAWTIPGTGLVFLVFLVYLKFLLHLPQPAKKEFLIAGFLFLSGAIGVEHLSDYYVEPFGMDNFGYQLLTTLEESLEMSGVVFFIRALLRHLSADGPENTTMPYFPK